VLQAGGVLTSSYLFLVLACALAPASEPIAVRAPVPFVREAAALGLALCSLLLGLVHLGAYLPVPAGVPSSSFNLDGVWKVLWPVLAGVALAILLGRWGDRPPPVPLAAAIDRLVRPTRRPVLALGGIVEGADGVLRQWPAAGLSLLLIAVIFAAAMLAAGGGP
jgi:hypothetical protein